MKEPQFGGIQFGGIMNTEPLKGLRQYRLNMKIDAEKSIRQIVHSSVESFSQGFEARHLGEVDNPDGIINRKIHNVFIAVLGEEIQYYAALVRSFDSSLGNMLESMAINIAELFYDVRRKVEGPLTLNQTRTIAELLEAYKNSNNPLTPSTEDYKKIIEKELDEDIDKRVHKSDYYLIDTQSNKHYLIELKIGGDLDSKKARSEKEAIFEQYAILSNVLGKDADIKCYFATAYNKYGEGREWNQQRVLKFFSKDELLIAKDFWNFVCCSDEGYKIVIDEYKKSSYLIKKALGSIKEAYLS